MSRVETKYITVKKINHNYFSLNRYFEQSYRDRKINNIYFDTLNDNFYNDHVEGSLIRHKVRVRWYDMLEKHHTQTSKEFFLEIKIKNKTKTSKFKTKLKNFNNLNIDLNYINSEYSKLLNKENLKIKFSCLFPKIKNSYKRKYFIISHDQNNRLTLDYDLDFTNYCGDNLPSNFKFSTYFNILEHKYVDKKNKYIQLNNLNFKKTGFSKYIFGCSKIKNHDFTFF